MPFSQLEIHLSRTEQKKAHERLQDLAVMLANLPKKHWKNLPASDYFLDELTQLASITSFAAKNRQIKRVGKLMIDENRHALVDVLFSSTFDNAQSAKITTWYKRLTLNDDNTLKQFVRQFKRAEHHTLSQLLLWISYAKHHNDDELLTESQQDFETYIKEVALLSL